MRQDNLIVPSKRLSVAMSRREPLAAVAIAMVLVVGPTWMASRAQTPAEECHKEAAEPSGPVLRGRVVDEKGAPLANVTVALYSGVATRWRGQQAVTNDKGKYEFNPLTTGVVVRGGGEPNEFLVGVVFEHDTHVPGDGISWRDISITLDERENSVETLDLKMVPGGRVSGTVRHAETGEPMPDLPLILHNGVANERQHSYYKYASTDGQGEFTSDALYPGRYVIEINDGDFEGDRPYPKIGLVEVKAGETINVELTTRDLPQLQDPFRITGTATGEDGRSMVYGGVGVRLVGSDAKLRTRGGGIDGRNVFSLSFGPVTRGEVGETSPYGIGTHDVELFGNNTRFGYRLASRTPSEPLRITDDPSKPEVEDGIRYLRPGEEVEFKLVFERPIADTQSSTPQPATPAAKENTVPSKSSKVDNERSADTLNRRAVELSLARQWNAILSSTDVGAAITDSQAAEFAESIEDAFGEEPPVWWQSVLRRGKKTETSCWAADPRVPDGLPCNCMVIKSVQSEALTEFNDRFKMVLTSETFEKCRSRIFPLSDEVRIFALDGSYIATSLDGGTGISYSISLHNGTDGRRRWESGVLGADLSFPSGVALLQNHRVSIDMNAQGLLMVWGAVRSVAYAECFDAATGRRLGRFSTRIKVADGTTDSASVADLPSETLKPCSRPQ